MKQFTRTVTKTIEIETAKWNPPLYRLRLDCDVCGAPVTGGPWVMAMGRINGGERRGMRLCQECGQQATDKPPPEGGR